VASVKVLALALLSSLLCAILGCGANLPKTSRATEARDGLHPSCDHVTCRHRETERETNSAGYGGDPVE
jgi:hypothetical protein